MSTGAASRNMDSKDQRREVIGYATLGWDRDNRKLQPGIAVYPVSRGRLHR
jgi:hypothetical protein